MTLSQFNRLKERILAVRHYSDMLRELRATIREEMLDSGEYDEYNVDENLDWLFSQVIA